MASSVAQVVVTVAATHSRGNVAVLNLAPAYVKSRVGARRASSARKLIQAPAQGGYGQTRTRSGITRLWSAEVVHEAGDRTIVLAAIIGNDPAASSRNGSAWRLIDRLGADLELRPEILRQFGRMRCARNPRGATIRARTAANCENGTPTTSFAAVNALNRADTEDR